MQLVVICYSNLNKPIWAASTQLNICLPEAPHRDTPERHEHSSYK